MYQLIREHAWPVATLATLMAAAGAITVGVRAGAADVPIGSTYVPMVPCRLFDTRPGPDAVGDRLTPLTEEETFTQQVTGTIGNCSLPGDAVSVAINLTAVNGTAASFLTVAPAGEELPLASTLNWVPGSPPLPNQAVVGLSSAGAIDLFNRFGTVDVLGDVVGYNTEADLEDLHERLDEVVTLKADLDEVYTRDVINTIHRGLPSTGGYVNADGSVNSNYLTLGTWTVTHSATGTYRVDETARGSCIGRDRPLIVVTTDAAAYGHVFVSCDVASEEFRAFINIRRGDTNALTDLPFNFVWIDG